MSAKTTSNPQEEPRCGVQAVVPQAPNGDRSLGVGIIGLGVGAAHIAGFETHPKARVVAACDIDPDRLAWLAALRPDIRGYGRYQDLLEDPAVEVVSVASYDDAHFVQARDALASGRHLFVEKPLCLSRDELVVLEALHRKNPTRILSSNLVLRRSPRFMALKKRLAAGDLGRITHGEGDYLYGRLSKLTEGWRGRIPAYSVTLGGTVHLVDLLLWLTGVRPVEVFGLGSSFHCRPAGRDLEDFRIGLVRCAGGETLKVSASFGCVHPHFHDLRLLGSLGSFHNRPGPAEYRFNRQDAAPELDPSSYPAVAKGALLPEFVAACLGQGRAVVSAAEVFSVMELCLALDASCRSGQPEPIPAVAVAGSEDT